MLKVYKVDSYVSINNQEWFRVGSTGVTMRDDNPVDKDYLDGVAFDECCKYLKHNKLDGVWLDYTLIKKKPILCVDYGYFNEERYKYVDAISYKNVFSEWQSVSLEYIIKHFPAEKCIQYLKERGMTTCPILK
jgi:hypothetical protein